MSSIAKGVRMLQTPACDVRDVHVGKVGDSTHHVSHLTVLALPLQ
jgi:hypothetical protein